LDAINRLTALIYIDSNETHLEFAFLCE